MISTCRPWFLRVWRVRRCETWACPGRFWACLGRFSWCCSSTAWTSVPTSRAPAWERRRRSPRWDRLRRHTGAYIQDHTRCHVGSASAGVGSRFKTHQLADRAQGRGYTYYSTSIRLQFDRATTIRRLAALRPKSLNRSTWLRLAGHVTMTHLMTLIKQSNVVERPSNRSRIIVVTTA